MEPEVKQEFREVYKELRALRERVEELEGAKKTHRGRRHKAEEDKPHEDSTGRH